ncbi:extracellular solute-binding protein [Pseudomonas fulva]|uniref:ABC transporter substrate-binding protein n=1 Tax=Pseudomonas fulva TaxID=47880 RepID=UPI00201D8382|nr:extracellular solute-binding protein [Pseudomonas fulva]UQY33015.1 extracellular solute-binding protein [Pseudomonas fulva]
MKNTSVMSGDRVASVFLKSQSNSAVKKAARMCVCASLFAGLVGGAQAEDVGGELQVMAWEGYDLTVQAEAWRKAHNVTLESASIASQDDVHTKFLTPNPPAIDLAEYNQAYSDLYINKLKIAKPINLENIPNYSADKVYSVFYDKPTWSQDGKQWGIPWIWGMSTILFNPAKVSAEPTSYTDLLKPEYKGKIAIMDDATGSWPVAARVAGFGEKYPLLTRDELKAVFKEFSKYRNQARLIALNQGDLANFMASGEVIAALSADPAIISQVEAQGVEIKTAKPKEGVVLWVDAWFMPPGADNVATAEAYMNQALDPKVQAEVAMALSQAPVSKDAQKFMDQKSRDRYDLDNIDQTFDAGLPGIPPVEDDGAHATYSDWVSAWQEFKAGM